MRTRPTAHFSRLTLRDGTGVLVRPLREADRAAVDAMHGRCSVESRWLRYLSPLPKPTPQMFTGMCDPAKGRTLVAETNDRIVAVAQIAFEDDGAELGILIEDAWQNQGLGTALTRTLLTLAHTLTLPKVNAQMRAENTRMAHILQNLGIKTYNTPDPGLIKADLTLTNQQRPAA